MLFQGAVKSEFGRTVEFKDGGLLFDQIEEFHRINVCIRGKFKETAVNGGIDFNNFELFRR